MGAIAMMTEWKYMAQIIAPNKETGESLYAALSAFPDDPLPDEGVFNTALNNGAFATEMLVKQSLVDIATQLKGGGYPAELTSKGFTHGQLDSIRSTVHVGWYHLFSSGQRVVNPSALDDFIAANGFTKI